MDLVFSFANTAHCTSILYLLHYQWFSDCETEFNKMKGYIILLAVLISNGYLLRGQPPNSQKPKLVIGIIVDQMRFDQLYKYEAKYSEGGFKRLVREGFNFKNTNYNFIPTYTATGHASIYSGTTPSYHGIIGNFWFDRETAHVIGNVIDTTESIVGSKSRNAFGASPKNLLTTTISDELRLASNFRSKVVSVSLKDRGAILPGGHTATAAYWFDWESSPGYFVSSTYYMDAVPGWVSSFNNEERSNAFLDTTWNTLFPVAEYIESAADDNPYEPSLGGKPKPTFPYDLKEMRLKYRGNNVEYQLMLVSPDGNTLLTEFAMEAIKNEKLGADGETDLLNISYSVTDVVGHTFGPQSVELEDVYLRLDRNLETLFNYLDTNVGKGNYLLFLTSDHGVLPVASYLHANKLPAGVGRIKGYRVALDSYLNSIYGNRPWISYFEEDQIYLNRDLILERKLSLATVQQQVAEFMATLEGIHSVVTAHDLQTRDFSNGLRSLVQNGYLSARSGDVFIILNPGIVLNVNSEINIEQVKGTTHGTGFAYDRHVPLIWMGRGIPHGESVRPVSPIDISPSLAMFLNLQLPSGSVGVPLTEIFR